eukprot:m.22009 g.22009  ORF g.22009 m.22009 type:complete len:226 (-) comp13643_c1_seq1:39-716(-)
MNQQDDSGSSGSEGCDSQDQGCSPNSCCAQCRKRGQCRCACCVRERQACMVARHDVTIAKERLRKKLELRRQITANCSQKPHPNQPSDPHMSTHDLLNTSESTSSKKARRKRRKALSKTNTEPTIPNTNSDNTHNPPSAVSASNHIQPKMNIRQPDDLLSNCGGDSLEEELERFKLFCAAPRQTERIEVKLDNTVFDRYSQNCHKKMSMSDIASASIRYSGCGVT